MKGFCNGCGDCCRVVIMNRAGVNKVKNDPGVTTTAPGYEGDDHDIARTGVWIRHELHEITFEEAYKRRPFLRRTLDPKGEAAPYVCDNFNEETNMCMNYENRPSICRDFPWYNGMKPNRQQLEDVPNCGYLVDVEDADV